MAEIKKALSSRRRYRMHLTKLLQNLNELVRSEQPLTEGDNITLRDTLDQLQHKEGLIVCLDAKILELLTDDEEVEELQAEEINSLITTAKTKITHHLTASISTHPSPLQLIHAIQKPERAVTKQLAFPPTIFRKSYLQSYLLAALLGLIRGCSGHKLICRSSATSELNFKGKHVTK